ncbi:hypothetical protein ACFFX1_12860 [Dactylosporangium sucinum]|nr:hypothetical protein [Dactylosporangium sucinum]
MIVWDAGVFTYNDSVYTSATRSLHPRNVSAARLRCAVSAE